MTETYHLAGYCRHKTTSPVCLGRQIAAVKAYALTAGWGDPKCFIDQEIAGARNEKPALQALVEFCEAHPSTKVIVESYRHLSRDYLELYRIMRRLDEAGANVVAVDDPELSLQDVTRALRLAEKRVSKTGG